jgi:hypothetical protein
VTHAMLVRAAVASPSMASARTVAEYKNRSASSLPPTRHERSSPCCSSTSTLARCSRLRIGEDDSLLARIAKVYTPSQKAEVTRVAVGRLEQLEAAIAKEEAVARHGRPERVMDDKGSAFWSWRGISRCEHDVVAHMLFRTVVLSPSASAAINLVGGNGTG